jgi:seryl-tRNA synthetase
METAKRDFNLLNKQIGELRKAKQDATDLQEQSKALKERVKELEAREKDLSAARDAAIVPIGNLVHDSVPVSDDEANNAVVREWGTPRPREENGHALLSHVDLVQLLGIVNLDAGTTVAGGRGYYLTNEGPLLNQALITHAMGFAHQRGFAPVHTPFFMRQEIMAECAQLSQFDDELYKVTGEGEDKYLIATSEQTLCALHRKGWFERSDLPRKYVGYSTCFRKEAGSHGRDTLGIFRVHQFEKVEQFVIASPEGDSSWQVFEEMLSNAEGFYQGLGLPYRVVNIVSGELNNAAAKKYDLEAWFPASATHRELVSCSNCTDYQSRRLEVRVRPGGGAAGGADAAAKAATAAASTASEAGSTATAGAAAAASASGESRFAHMLNATLTATERTLCCVLETYQTPHGVRVPEALRRYMPGEMDFIPFRRRMDTDKGKGYVDLKPEERAELLRQAVAAGDTTAAAAELQQ